MNNKQQKAWFCSHRSMRQWSDKMCSASAPRMIRTGPPLPNWQRKEANCAGKEKQLLPLMRLYNLGITNFNYIML